MSRTQSYCIYLCGKRRARIKCGRGCEWAKFSLTLEQRIADVRDSLDFAYDSDIDLFHALSSEQDDFLAELRDHAPLKAADLLEHAARKLGRPLGRQEVRQLFRFYSLRHRVAAAERALLAALPVAGTA